eukprot:TRINITY_DN77486_c0_g1_i1.p1 TRINITY_DN77486_c0_g1~~TRINITY_DN77486_c0_g1_i1.p1  ORF type:complete len:158 (+),score=15.30 TRINITY_DN77486_c0_g1_i1:74-547(+)
MAQRIAVKCRLPVAAQVPWKAVLSLANERIHSHTRYVASASGRSDQDGAEADVDTHLGCLKLFGLSREATRKEIRERYIALAKRCHPDVAAQVVRAESPEVEPNQGSARVESASVDAEAFRRLRRCYELLNGTPAGRKPTPDWLRKMKEDFAHYPAC